VKKKAIEQTKKKAAAGSAKAAASSKRRAVAPRRQPASGSTVKKGPAPAGAAKPAPLRLSQSQRQELRASLLALRERIHAQIQALKGDSLQRHDEVNTAEDGTDAFERQFALNIVSSENEALMDIDDALQQLEEGTYGVCEDCGGLIEVPRLKALPFVRKCVGCQAKSEAGKVPFRPMRGTEEL